MINNLDLNIIIQKYNDYLTYDDNKLDDFPFIKDEFTLNLHKKRLEELEHECDLGLSLGNFEVPSMKDIFKRLSLKSDLSIDELYSCLCFFKSLSNYCSSLSSVNSYEIKELYLDLIDLPSLHNRLDISITEDMEISDEASSTLKSLRKKRVSLESSLTSTIKTCQKKYLDYVSDTNLSYRNGYLSLPIKSNFKSRVAGIEVSSSNTKSTSYIVPYEMIEVYNKIAEIEGEIQEEIARIIHELSSMLISSFEIIQKDYKTCLLIDRLYSSVLFGNSYNGVIAKTSDRLCLKGLGHPLIEEDRLIRNSVELGGNNSRALLISGPNAGGKTILLKSIALAVIMNQAGLFVPCATSAELPLFQNLHFVSGDNQSVLDNLSTYSSHIKYLKGITSNISSSSLIIIDEIGQGTSPLEGSALGVSFFKFAEKHNAYIIITSHYDELKDYALKSKSISSGMMMFDEEKVEPTYTFIPNRAGQSFGLTMAKKLGLDSSIISEAEEYISKQKQTTVKKDIALLESKIEEYQNMIEEVDKQKKRLDELISKKERAITNFQNAKRNIEEKEEAIIEEAIDERLKKIDEIWKKKKPITTFAELSKIKGALNKEKQSKIVKDTENKNIESFEIGDKVRLKLSGQVGVVKDKSGKRYTVLSNGISFKVKAEELEIFIQNEPHKIIPHKVSNIDKVILNTKTLSTECNLIGLYVEEGRQKLIKYLDDCLVAKRHQARIIHGVGTSRLQKMVWAELKKCSFVSSYRFGGEGEGGVGCTVVYFK